MSDNTKKKTLYHYTDKEGAKGILKDRKITKSVRTDSGDDAVKGPGVYLTDISLKEMSKLEAAKNLFDDRALPNKMVKDGRMDYTVKVEVDKTKVKEVIPERRVWLHPDEDLDINNKGTKVYRNK